MHAEAPDEEALAAIEVRARGTLGGDGVVRAFRSASRRQANAVFARLASRADPRSRPALTMEAAGFRSYLASQGCDRRDQTLGPFGSEERALSALIDRLVEALIRKLFSDAKKMTEEIVRSIG